MRYLGAECDDYTALASAQLRVERATSLLVIVFLALVTGPYLLTLLIDTSLTDVKQSFMRGYYISLMSTIENGDCTRNSLELLWTRAVPTP